jgi:phosphatidylserine/phosphatidylglycerophosphate/cardiolipin synthase-like enzyme
MMIKAFLAALLLLITTTAFPARIPVTADVYFSPNGGAADAVIHEIDHAKSEIRIQAYSFTHAGIAKALVDAKQRGLM